MRTMYIILSWIGWAWLAVAGPMLAIAFSRKRRCTPAEAPVEAEVRP